MPDRSLVISSFKYGLDTRREALASLPGTLQTCQNGHINSGGEVEKRKAFVKDANLFPSNTFGFQDTSTGPMVFGSDASPNGTLPTGVVYQQLTHPRTPAPGSLNAVIFSCCFQGLPFVLCTFANDTTTFAYYNGVLVAQITDGIVLNATGSLTAPETLNDLATDCAAIINRITGWTAHANVTASQASDTNGYHETALAGSVLVMSPTGVHFTPVVQNNNSVNGSLGVKLIDQNFAGTPATGSATSFKITGSSAASAIQVQAPQTASAQNPMVNLTNGFIPFNGTSGQTAADVATAINNNTFLTGYTAVGDISTSNVTVTAPASFGAFTLNLVVSTLNMPTTAGNIGQVFALKLSTTSLVVTTHVPSFSITGVASGTITASVSGTTNAATTFTWTPISYINSQSDNPPLQYACGTTSIGSSVNSNSVVGPTLLLVFNALGGRSVQATFKCVAHDGLSPDVTVYFNVLLSINVP